MTVLTSSTKFILNILKCYIRGLKSWRFWMNVSTSHVMNLFVCSKRIQKLLFHAFSAKHLWLALSNTECAFSSPILQLSFRLWNYIRDNRWERNPSCVSKLSNEAVYSVKPSAMLLFSFNVFVISIGSCWHRILYNLSGSVIEDSENVFFFFCNKSTVLNVCDFCLDSLYRKLMGGFFHSDNNKTPLEMQK